MARRPNVLIIHTDEQRTDTLRLYGNPLVQTPHIDALAARGVTFDRAYVAYPQCIPSRASFMTGRYPHTTGSTANSRTGHASMQSPGLLLQDREQQTLPAVLKAAGYRTALAGKNHCFNATMLAQFDFVRQVAHWGPDAAWKPDLARRFWAFVREADLFGDAVVAWAEAPFGEDECPAGLAADAALEFLEQEGREEKAPFFLWLSISEPHLPFTAPAPWSRKYRPEDVTIPAWHPGELVNKPERQRVLSRMYGLHHPPDERKLRELVAMYWGLVSYADHEIGRVLTALEQRGLLDDTIVVYSTDHGDFMGEHQQVHKSCAFYDCLTRTPLVISWPAGGVLTGRRRDALVSNIDIMPTVLDLAGIPVPDAIQGHGFAPLLRGESYVPREAVFAEAGILAPPRTLADLDGALLPPDPFAPRTAWQQGERRPMRAWDGRAKMIRTDRWKYNHYLDNGERELYDMQADPGELTNLAGDAGYVAVESGLRTRLLDWCITTEDTSYGR